MAAAAARKPGRYISRPRCSLRVSKRKIQDRPLKLRERRLVGFRLGAHRS
jgi:hypothetical protein